MQDRKNSTNCKLFRFIFIGSVFAVCIRHREFVRYQRPVSFIEPTVASITHAEVMKYMNTRICDRFRLITPIIFICLFVLPAMTQNKPQHSEFRSIDGLLKAFYESLGFPEGKSPDWERFRSLFGYATSPCVRVAGDSVMTMDREGFIAFFTGRITRGTLKSFDEKELSRNGEYYGNIAQVFSTYEKRMNLAGGGAPIRGINSFSLYFKKDRWWIASVVWQDEAADKPIPEKYVKAK